MLLLVTHLSRLDTTLTGGSYNPPVLKDLASDGGKWCEQRGWKSNILDLAVVSHVVSPVSVASKGIGKSKCMDSVRKLMRSSDSSYK